MPSYLKSRLRRPAVKVDSLLAHRRTHASHEEEVTSTQFVSFLQQSGFRSRQIDRHARSRRTKKAIGLCVASALLAGCAYIATESAKALAFF